MALFSGLLFNTPETLLGGRLTTKGRIEYQFKIYSGITVVFIESKLDIGSLTERLRGRSVASSDQNEGFRMELIWSSNLILRRPFG